MFCNVIFFPLKSYAILLIFFSMMTMSDLPWTFQIQKMILYYNTKNLHKVYYFDASRRFNTTILKKKTIQWTMMLW